MLADAQIRCLYLQEILLSHDIPMSKKASPTVVQLQCTAVASVVRQQWNKKMLKSGNVTESRRKQSMCYGK